MTLGVKYSAVRGFAEAWLAIGHVAAALAEERSWPRRPFSSINYCDGTVRTREHDLGTRDDRAFAWLERTPIADCGCSTCRQWSVPRSPS